MNVEPVGNITNDRLEDNLEWMEINEDVLDSDLKEKFHKLSMNEMEQSELIDTWNNEYENNGTGNVGEMKKELGEIDQIVEKMKKMIESTSNFEGIENIDSLGTENNEEYSESDDENSYDYDSENDEILLEREIFEAINFDPDLLMKILEVNANMEVSSEEFIKRFHQYQQENPVKTGDDKRRQMRQKGIADIETGKVEEARKSRRKEIIEIDGEEGSDEEFETEKMEMKMEMDFNENKIVAQNDEISRFDKEEEEVTDEFIYGQTLDQFKQSSGSKNIEEDESEGDEKEIDPSYHQDHQELPVSYQDYYDAMDSELLASGGIGSVPGMLDESEIETNLGKSVIETIGTGGNGTPMETVISSLGKRFPKPRNSRN